MQGEDGRLFPIVLKGLGVDGWGFKRVLALNPRPSSPSAERSAKLTPSQSVVPSFGEPVLGTASFKINV